MEKQRMIVVEHLSPSDGITWDGLKRAGMVGPYESPEEQDEAALRAARSPIINVARLVGRNERCPSCASGKKFKHCCGKGLASRGFVRSFKRRDQ